jgi:hypothetical protein
MCDRATLAPPDLAWTWQQEFPGTPDQLGHLRAGLRTFLEDCPATDDVALLVTELAANAIAFSASGRPAAPAPSASGTCPCRQASQTTTSAVTCTGSRTSPLR